MLLTLERPHRHAAGERCHLCGGKVSLSEIEAHPRQPAWEILGFSCSSCGPVKSIVMERVRNVS